MDQFSTIAYLKQGNSRQQQAWQLLTDYSIFEILKSYSPILTGTIPIEIDIEGSDLDIICSFKNAAEFYNLLVGSFSKLDSFQISKSTIKGMETIIANFFINGAELEIFGQNRSIFEQEAYRHMMVEYQILQEKGEAFKQQIIDLKNAGFKTEPAFAIALGLAGDPYGALLQLYQDKNNQTWSNYQVWPDEI